MLRCYKKQKVRILLMMYHLVKEYIDGECNGQNVVEEQSQFRWHKPEGRP